MLGLVIGFATKNTLAGALIVVDFRITASVKGAEQKYEQAGDIANAAEMAKVKQYQARYDVPNENIIGIAIETSGAWGPRPSASCGPSLKPEAARKIA